MNAISRLRQLLPAECFTDRCERDGLSVSLGDAPSPCAVVDLGSESLDSELLDVGDVQRCDFLLLGEAETGTYVVPIEMNRGSMGAIAMVSQLQAGVDCVNRWLPNLDEFDLVPILVHNGLPKAERDRLRHHTVRFGKRRVWTTVTQYDTIAAPHHSGALAVALEAAIAQRRTEYPDEASNLPEQLQRFVVGRDSGEVVSVTEAASRLGVSRTTIYDWAEKNRLIAWRSTKRGLNIPAAQIVETGKVAPGLADVVDVVGSPRLAWAFLSREWPFDDGVELPLERLNAGGLDDVLGAAAGFGATFT